MAEEQLLNGSGIQQPRARRPIDPRVKETYEDELKKPSLSIPERTPMGTPAPPEV